MINTQGPPSDTLTKITHTKALSSTVRLFFDINLINKRHSSIFIPGFMYFHFIHFIFRGYTEGYELLFNCICSFK